MITLDLSILNQKGTPMFYSDTLALRPAFGIAGRIFIDIASPYGIYRDTGSAWVQIAGSGSGGIGGSGTATQIAFFSAATTLTSSSNLFWDNTNARLGVNTNTPSASLDVHSAVQSVIQANNTALGNSFLSFQLQGTGKWQIGNVYNAGDNYFRVQDQFNTLERLTIRNTGQINFLGYTQILNTVTGITGTTPSELPNNYFSNNFTFNSGITTVASVNTIGLDVDNSLNYSGANTINNTSYNTSSLLRNLLTFGSAAASITYTQATGIRALVNNQVQYFQSGANSGTISHYANIQILGDNKNGAGFTNFTNRYGILINDFNEFTAGNTYSNRWGIYQAGTNESNFFAGVTTIGNNAVIEKNFNGSTSIQLKNTTAGTASVAQLQIFSDAVSAFTFGRFSSTTTSFSWLSPNDSFIYQNEQNIIIACDSSSKVIKFGNTKIGSAPMTLTASGRLLIGTTTEISSATMVVSSSTQGFLPPRMTTGQKNSIASPIAGLLVYDSTLNKLCVYTTAWETITSI